MCVVETTKATVEVESPGAGTIVQLYGEDVEVELGKTIAYVAETAEELAGIDAKAEEKPAPKPAAGDRKATRKAVELAELHGIDLSAVEKRGFITEKDVEELIAAQKASAAPVAEPALAGVSTEGVSLPATFDLDDTAGALDPAFLESLDHDAFRALAPPEKVTALRDAGARIGEGVDLGRGLARRRSSDRDRRRREARSECHGRRARRSSRSASSPSSALIWSSAAGVRSSAPGSGAVVRFASVEAVTATPGRR